MVTLVSIQELLLKTTSLQSSDSYTILHFYTLYFYDLHFLYSLYLYIVTPYKHDFMISIFYTSYFMQCHIL